MPSPDAENPVPIDTQFDAVLANALARLESYNKHLYRPNSYLHKWWARRCGSTFRLILKALVADPQQRDYYMPGGLEGKIILDPMMGGATVLHEAIRLGANVIGADLDPIPVLQARATLTECPLEELESAFERLISTLRSDLLPLFLTACPVCGRSTEIRFTLYGLRRTCTCGQALVVDSTILRHESDNSVIHICPNCRVITRAEQSGPVNCLGCTSGPTRPPLVEKSRKVCQTCGSPYRDELQTPFYTRYEPMAVISRCDQHGQLFARPTRRDLEQLERANVRRSRFEQGQPPGSPWIQSDDFVVRPGPKSSDLLRRGITSYLDLFSSRQLLFLQRAIEELTSFNPLVRLNLALLLSTSLEFNSMLCGYKGAGKRRPGAIRHTFSHHAYSFPFTALENNPLYPRKSSGTLQKLFHDRIRRARSWARKPVERRIVGGSPRTEPVPGRDIGLPVTLPAELRHGTRRFLLIQGSSASLDLEPDSVDAVITDPPYFDSVQYSDLAAFFHVWLKQMLPDQADWDVDLSQSAVDPLDGDGEQYTQVLTAIFAECRRVLDKTRGRLVFTFHHRNPTGWAALTLALKRAHFTLRNRYIVHSENPTSVHIANLRALTHDAILVLAPVRSGGGQQWQAPRLVDRRSSFTFCQDCSSVLGWMLDVDLEEGEIEQLWSRLLV